MLILLVVTAIAGEPTAVGVDALDRPTWLDLMMTLEAGVLMVVVVVKVSDNEALAARATAALLFFKSCGVWKM